MATAKTRMPMPAPMPALAPVDKPPELVPPADAAATDGVLPGVLVMVPMATIVVAGVEARTIEVTVV